MSGEARRREAIPVLTEAGWLVLRFWEHLEPESCAATVIEAVAARRQEVQASKRPKKTS